MQNSKLIDLLRNLSPREWRTFREMAAAPYFNRNPDVLRLANWLDSQAPAFEKASRAAAQEALFPGEAPDEARLNHLMSFLLKLGEEFIALEEFRKDNYAADYFALLGLNRRGLDKHYRFNLEKARRAFAAETQKGGASFQGQYAVEIMEAERFSHNSPRQFNESVQKATDSLDAFYLLEKLRRTCYMYSSQAILATPYNLQLTEEICRFTEANLKSMPTPAIEGYYRIFQLLTRENPHDDFQALKLLLATRAHEFSRDDLTDIYQYAINFCTIQVLKVQDAYIAEAFDLYTRGIDSGILLDSGNLSPWHFKNIINLSLKLKKYAWTEQFINENTRLLLPEYQQDAWHFNRALLFYNTQRLAEAMNHLNKVEFTDVHYSLGAKVMLCQIYYQHDDYDALESLLHSFNNFLRRNKLLAENTRLAYLNFVQILRKIIRQQPGQMPTILREAEKMPALAGKEWLVRIMANG